MSEPTHHRRRPRRGGVTRPSAAAFGVIRVDPDFADEFPDGDPTCTEAHASLARAGSVLLQELDRSILATFGIPQAAATALAVVDGAGEPLTPSEIGQRVLVASATITSTLDLLERRGWVERRPNPEDRRSVLVAITPAGRVVVDQLLPGIRAVEVKTLGVLTRTERRQLVALLDQVLARAAEVAAEPPMRLEGRRNRPARLGYEQAGRTKNP